MRWPGCTGINDGATTWQWENWHRHANAVKELRARDEELEAQNEAIIEQAEAV